MTEEWRDWRLVWYDADLVKRPPDKPVAGAELSADGAWATGFVDGRVAAMWMRYRMPTRDALRRAAARTSDVARERTRRHPTNPLN